MKGKVLGAIMVAVLLLLVFAAWLRPRLAGHDRRRSSRTRRTGRSTGNWTAEEIRAALAYVEANPIDDEYSKVKGTLEDYLASLQAPGEQGGELAFTGGEIILILGAGVGLIGSGALLRRRRA